MRLLELYDTVQGEGPNIGKPTTFIRFAGCNLRCPGWPCDTPYSIEPAQWRHEMEEVAPMGIFSRLIKHPTKHVCITGGEPMLQSRHQLDTLFNALVMDHYTVDVFTNGTRPFVDYMSHDNVTVVMDWKLKGSGEGLTLVEERFANINKLASKDAIKFVCKDRDDFLQAIQVMETINSPVRYYFGVAWGELTEATLVNWMLEEGLRDAWLNVQVHKYVWEPTARRI